MKPTPVYLGTGTAWLRFHGCEPEYIRDVCRGRCCHAPSRPGGTLITIHRNEAEAIAARGGTVLNGRLVTQGACTFKDPDSALCALHETPDKPFGCIASPWTLSQPRGVSLIVRNRYKMLVCYATNTERRGGDASGFQPAFRAFRRGLNLILGDAEAARVCGLLEHYGDARAEGYTGPARIEARIPLDTWRTLMDNDESKKQ
jgi:hypothetical protein